MKATVTPLRDNHYVCPRCEQPTSIRYGETRKAAQRRHEESRPLCRQGGG